MADAMNFDIEAWARLPSGTGVNHDDYRPPSQRSELSKQGSFKSGFEDPGT